MKRSSLLLLACLFTAGCGATADVKGTVTYKGKALAFGTVTAMPLEGNGLSVNAEIEADGKYTLKGVGVGKAKFLVVAQDAKILEEAKKFAFADKENVKKDKGPRVPKGDSSKAEALMKKASVIPEKYGDPTKEHLSYTVVRGENTYDIKLE